jgi:hypothetical protein
VPTYDADQLRQFLELWGRDDGHLSLEQMQALADWEETPESARQELNAAIEERRPLTSTETDYAAADTSPAPRERGLFQAPEPESRPLFQRLAAAIRNAFFSSSKR